MNLMQSLAAKIDHTALKAEVSLADIDQLTEQARKWGFASVCVNPIFVSRAISQLRGSGIPVCTVVGFPLGANTLEDKMHETATAMRNGAEEIDMVAHIPSIIEGDYRTLFTEIRGVVGACRQHNQTAVVKVIVESALLMKDVPPSVGEARIGLACKAVREAGADYIKTSTGFHSAGNATVEAVQLMKKYADGIRVKASGGIKTYRDALKMIEAGAERLGCSAGVAIMEEVAKQ